jgi:hypothetical protein
VRTLLELMIAAAIIALGWDQPFSERVPWFPDKTPKSSDHSRSSISNPRPTGTASGSWMWDPKRQSILDTPRPKPSATVSSSLLDPNHKSPLDSPAKTNATPH